MMISRYKQQQQQPIHQTARTNYRLNHLNSMCLGLPGCAAVARSFGRLLPRPGKWAHQVAAQGLLKAAAARNKYGILNKPEIKVQSICIK
jgi:hypothetical protein